MLNGEHKCNSYKAYNNLTTTNLTCIRVTRTHIGLVSNTFKDLKIKPVADRCHPKKTETSIQNVCAKRTLAIIELSHNFPESLFKKVTTRKMY